MKSGAGKIGSSDISIANLTDFITRYCRLVMQDPQQYLLHVDKREIIAFFIWILKVSRVKSHESLIGYWKRWCALYRRHVGVSLHAATMQDISDVSTRILVSPRLSYPIPNRRCSHCRTIPFRCRRLADSLGQFLENTLSPSSRLSRIQREKPVLNVDDLYKLLYYLWAHDQTVFCDERQRLQLHFLILITAYTASRPGALVWNPANEIERQAKDSRGDSGPTPGLSTWNGLAYRHVTLVILPSPTAVRGVLLCAEISLDHLKGWHSHADQ